MGVDLPDNLFFFFLGGGGGVWGAAKQDINCFLLIDHRT